MNLWLEEMDGYSNNPEKSSTATIGEHIPFGYLMSTIWGYVHIENKHTLFCGKDCMKTFCNSLREDTKNIIDFEKKKYCS